MVTTLGDLGLTDNLRAMYSEARADDLSCFARVISEHKELYVIQNEEGRFNAEITGNMRFSAESRADFPAVGDWVEATIFDGERAIIHKIHKRFSMLERQSVGTQGEKQLIATNINMAFIVQAVDRDFNLNRLERYFVIAHNGNIDPVIILNKVDLISHDQLQEIELQVKERMKNAPVFLTSTMSGFGIQELLGFLKAGMTYCFIGSSGVGKSSIINYISGKELLGTNEISDATKKGKHTTTHRELILMDNGSILVDTPGMREIGLTEADFGLENTFQDIAELSKGCKFTNCTHEDEPGCKVMEAIEEGNLSIEELDNYKKLERQSTHFTSTVAEKRKKDKAFGKLIKNTLSVKKKKKY